MRNYLELGSWNVICDRCGFKFKNHMLKDEWTGLKVCTKCFETRHPQTLIKVPEDDPSVPWTRPQPDDVFITLSIPLTVEPSGDWLTTESGDLLGTEN